MSNAPLTKYTDRDVREDSSLVEMALAYLRTYEGEFQFLVDCKMRLATETPFTPGMVRGILNCMRVDPRAPEMPEPLPPEEGRVVAMAGRRKKNQQPRLCDIEEFHGPHGGYHNGKRDPDYEYCRGKYAINRSDFQVHALIKASYAMGRSGARIHRVKEGWFMWRVHPHTEGYRGAPDLYVRTICTFPRMLERPILISSRNLTEAVGSRIMPSLKTRILCERCFANGN